MANKPILIPDGVGFGDETLSKYDEGTWVPDSYTNFVLGNGTFVGRYVRVGKKVTLSFKITLGSTSGFNASPFAFQLPAALNPTSAISHVGSLILEDAGTRYYAEGLSLNTTGLITPIQSGSSYFISSNNPFSWGTNDTLVGTITYELA
jgi:hypothetical protein